MVKEASTVPQCWEQPVLYRLVRDSLCFFNAAVVQKLQFGAMFRSGNENASPKSEREVFDMLDDGRVVTCKLPREVAARLDEAAQRADRSKSWIIRQALQEWLAEEQRRHELTLEALKSVDEGKTISHEEVIDSLKRRPR